MSAPIVKKFGGTSLGSVERIEAVAHRLQKDIERDGYPVVVASAMSGETNRLVQLAHSINPRYHHGLAYDMLLASGEQVSVALLAMALEKRGLDAMPLLAHQLGIRTDSLFSKARIQSVDSERLLGYLKRGIIPIVAGFQGVTEEDRITTLGRGGSDTTAVALAAALGSDICEIFTDVPAVFSADPRLVPKAREIPRLSFDEMMEMASVGSKVLHFRCVEIAAKYKVKIHVRSTFEDREGTWVVPEGEIMSQIETPVVSSITHDPGTSVFKIYPIPRSAGSLAGIFENLAEANVIVDIITQSESDEGMRLHFSVGDSDALQAEEILKRTLKNSPQILILNKMAKISAIGVGMKNHPGVAARFFSALEKKKVNVHLVTTSDIKISAVIDLKDLEVAARALHEEFGLNA